MPPHRQCFNVTCKAKERHHMKKLTTIILTFTLAVTALGQKYEPQILILTPNEFKSDKSFESELKSKKIELSKRPKNNEQAQYIKSDEFKKQPENIQKITLSEIKFTEKLDFTKEATFIAHQYLVYRFYERFTNLLILLSDQKSIGNLTDLRRIADTEKIQYVLNFSRIELFKRDGISFAKISVQFYDNVSQTFLINSEYEGDWTNPGFEFTCSDKSIDCTISNAISKALGDVIFQVASNSPTLKKERELAQLRFDELVTKYYSKPNDKDFLKPIVLQTDSNIVLNDQYQILVDPTKTKFVAFFIKQVSAQDFKTLKDNKRDKNVNIISNKNIKDEGFLDDIPQTYAYIIKGVKHNDKWYYEKSSVTYFEVKDLEEGKQEYFYNLAEWDFFKENSTEFNSNFWESDFFNIKERVSYSDEITKYKKEGEVSLNFENKIINEVIKPLTEKIKVEGNYEIVSLNQMAYDYLLVYPKEKNVILSPINVKKRGSDMFIRYFVLIPHNEDYEIYEWNYLDQKKFKNSKSVPSFMEQINTLVTWNFSYKKLDNPEFWEKYVLLKAGNDYKYLIKRQ